MKKIHLWILTLALVLTGCASYVPLTLSDTINEVVIASFLFQMEELALPEEEEKEDKGEFDILTLFRLKEVYDDIKEYLKDSNKLLPYKVFLDSIYRPIENGLRNELNIPIRPLKKYELGIQHDLFGFPLDSASLIAQSGKVDAALDISVNIEFPSTQASTSTWGGVTKTRVKGKPVLTLAVEMIDRNGKVIWRDSVHVKSDRKVIIDEKWLMGTKYKQSVMGPSVVELTEQAVKILVDKKKNL